MPETSLRPTQPCSIALPPSSCRCPDREHDRDSPPQRLPQARSHSQPARAIWQRLSGAGLTETSPTVREAPARTCRDPARDCTSPIRGQHPRRALARLPPMLHTPDETKTAQTRFLARLAGCHRRLQVGASLGLGFGDRFSAFRGCSGSFKGRVPQAEKIGRIAGKHATKRYSQITQQRGEASMVRRGSTVRVLQRA
jgi:hypothetical protein